MDAFFDSGVYGIVNLVNGKLYVGSSNDLKRREGDHVRMLRGDYHDNVYLQNSWNKHGEKNFTFIVLERCDAEECVKCEQKWLDRLKTYKFENGYNRSPAAGSCLGFKHSDETKARTAERMLGVPMEGWVKDRIRDALTGRRLSAEHRANLWKSRQGWKHSEETKKRISESLLKAVERGIKLGPPEGWTHSDEARMKMSAKQRGVPKTLEHRTKIAAALKGKRKSAEHIAKIEASKRKNRKQRSLFG